MANQSVPLTYDAPKDDAVWSLVQAAAREAERLSDASERITFSLGVNGDLRVVARGDADALIAWRPRRGWEGLLPEQDPRQAFIDLYMPICSATAARPVTVGHLGESLDGFIATHAGESRWVTGE